MKPISALIPGGTSFATLRFYHGKKLFFFFFFFFDLFGPFFELGHMFQSCGFLGSHRIVVVCPVWARWDMLPVWAHRSDRALDAWPRWLQSPACGALKPGFSDC
jgi:hypothetical protein